MLRPTMRPMVVAVTTTDVLAAGRLVAVKAASDDREGQLLVGAQPRPPGLRRPAPAHRALDRGLLLPAHGLPDDRRRPGRRDVAAAVAGSAGSTPRRAPASASASTASPATSWPSGSATSSSSGRPGRSWGCGSRSADTVDVEEIERLVDFAALQAPARRRPRRRSPTAEAVTPAHPRSTSSTTRRSPAPAGLHGGHGPGAGVPGPRPARAGPGGPSWTAPLLPGLGEELHRRRRPAPPPARRHRLKPAAAGALAVVFVARLGRHRDHRRPAGRRRPRDHRAGRPGRGPPHRRRDPAPGRRGRLRRRRHRRRRRCRPVSRRCVGRFVRSRDRAATDTDFEYRSATTGPPRPGSRCRPAFDGHLELSLGRPSPGRTRPYAFAGNALSARRAPRLPRPGSATRPGT